MPKTCWCCGRIQTNKNFSKSQKQQNAICKGCMKGGNKSKYGDKQRFIGDANNSKPDDSTKDLISGYIRNCTEPTEESLQKVVPPLVSTLCIKYYFDPVGYHRCFKCATVKPNDDFSPNNLEQTVSNCMECIRSTKGCKYYGDSNDGDSNDGSPDIDDYDQYQYWRD
eukprot:330102_1